MSRSTSSWVTAVRMSSVSLLVGLLCGTASAAPIDAAHSTLTARFEQMNVPVDASFRHFSGTVDFDPAHPSDASAHLEADTASLDLGDEDYNAEVRKKEWLDSADYPKAVFEASSLKQVAGKYQASGQLSLKGKTQRLTVTLNATAAAGATVFEGSVPISREAFDIGDAQWRDTVADEVQIRFRIVVPAVH